MEAMDGGGFALEPHSVYNNLRIYPERGKLERHIGLLCDLAEAFGSASGSASASVDLQIAGEGPAAEFVQKGCEARGVWKRVVRSADAEAATADASGAAPEVLPRDCPGTAPGAATVSVDADLQNTEATAETTVEAVPLIIYLASATADTATADTVTADLQIAESFILCRADQADALPHPYKYPLAEVPVEPSASATASAERAPENLVLCVPENGKGVFWTSFRYYFKGQEAGSEAAPSGTPFSYDNLIHLCIMVKNAGPLFEQVLQENMEIADRWTVLDTGSTDGTQDIVRRVFKNKKGVLVEEPFLNFRDSRNRCLELAGGICKYTLMLDDTYAIRGDLRSFLGLIRGDVFANSYSLMIQSDDTEYYSNRLLKAEDKLRYIYTIHEVVQAERNTTVVVPKEAAWILDHRAPYMETRTMERKRYDLDRLFEMLAEDPTNPRHLYYLGQTYNLLEDYENAAKYFEMRATSTLVGFHQEAVDSMFELGRLYNFKLGKLWALCEETYKKAYAMDTTRPDPLYFLGIHYYLEADKGDTERDGSREGCRRQAYEYFKAAFALGYPVHAQFSLKPTLAYHFLPKFLTQLCYEHEDYALGLAAAQRFLEKAKPTDDSYTLISDWGQIFAQLVAMGPLATTPIRFSGGREGMATGDKPLLVIVADGGWGPWTGSDIVGKGVGGSETWVIETARSICREGTYRVIVFCRCEQEEVFEGVLYRPIAGFGPFIANTEVQTCIVSRFSEYVPVALKGWTENVYLILHDLGPTGIIIPTNPKLRKVFCLSEWHKQFFLGNFPQFAGRTEVCGYGIDGEKFVAREGKSKVPYSFIYSSFPNRGLRPLLEMWPRIVTEFPEATLEVFSDIDGAWVNSVATDDMAAIRRLLAGGLKGVRVRGWVSKAELAAAWRSAAVWFYPCTFAETFCLTALEAQAAGTAIVCSDLAALQNTVGERGVLVPGDPRTAEWQERALVALRSVLGGGEEVGLGIARAWALGRSWQRRSEEFLQEFLKPTLLVNYGGMYNWTHDLPVGGRAVFERALQRFVGQRTRVLEIGTYAGTSLIEMLRLIGEGATGVGIDRWKNYSEGRDGETTMLKRMEEANVEAVFWKNVAGAGMGSRIGGLKGDSVDVLLGLVERGERFDFIYVDGSHKCIDCYTDMTLGWRLLKVGGIMAVDDYTYQWERVEAGEVLEYPFRGVDWFLEKRIGEYAVIEKGYRVFLEKIR